MKRTGAILLILMTMRIITAADPPPRSLPDTAPVVTPAPIDNEQETELGEVLTDKESESGNRQEKNPPSQVDSAPKTNWSLFYHRGEVKWQMKQYTQGGDDTHEHRILLTAGPKLIRQGEVITLRFYEGNNRLFDINLTLAKTLPPYKTLEINLGSIGISSEYYKADGNYRMGVLIGDEIVALNTNAMNSFNTARDRWSSMKKDIEVTSEGERTVYLVSNAEQLAYIAYCVNSGMNFDNVRIRLTDDIYLADRLWTPIGTDYAPFNGSFDGNHHTIHGLSVSDTVFQSRGLFGVIGQSGRVRDLKVTDANVINLAYTGILSGKNYGEIYNCEVQGNITGVNYAGGLVGLNTGIIEYSTANCIVTGGEGIGGLVGMSANSSQIIGSFAAGYISGNNHVGGFVGTARGGLFENCVAETDTLGYKENAAGFIGSVIDISRFTHCAVKTPAKVRAPLGNFVGSITKDALGTEFDMCRFPVYNALVNELQTHIQEAGGKVSFDESKEY